MIIIIIVIIVIIVIVVIIIIIVIIIILEGGFQSRSGLRGGGFLSSGIRLRLGVSGASQATPKRAR